MTIDHLHYDAIRAKPDGSCSRPRRLGQVCRESPRESPRVRNVIKMNMSRHLEIIVTAHFLEVESKKLNCLARVGETDAVSAV